MLAGTRPEGRAGWVVRNYAQRGIDQPGRGLGLTFFQIWVFRPTTTGADDAEGRCTPAVVGL
ncbi:hypothetical protein [Spirosoma spitsbergense]|uniref:hypothetical protein n=1 Tax=Spirosoma spitsbergense TaxID=431554 RepID=UPI0012FBF316|nr:hypothetical protein [Spirosoma spitsbergense]